MKGHPNDRAIILGQYIVENQSTVRAAAKHFGISKSTVHTVVQKGNAIFTIYITSNRPALVQGGFLSSCKL